MSFLALITNEIVSVLLDFMLTNNTIIATGCKMPAMYYWALLF